VYYDQSTYERRMTKAKREAGGMRGERGRRKREREKRTEGGGIQGKQTYLHHEEV
jgi:hypothetical protein